MINEKLCRFYSPDWLSELLVDTLAGLLPEHIVDLGSGPGSLSDAAGARWPTARITTVDVDPEVAALRSNYLERFSHVLRDVLADGLAPAVGVEPGSTDLAISNPPYTRTPRNPSIDHIMDRAGLRDAVPGWTSVPVDLAFLAQALLLVRPGGTVAFVVPDTLISSEAMGPARRLLIENHRIQTVIQLPRRTFGRTDALAFIVVIKKGERGETIKLLAVDDSGKAQTRIEIRASDGVHRLDCLFHAKGAPGLERKTLADLGVVVIRGRSDSRKVASANGGIFHTGDFPSCPGGRISLGARANTPSTPVGVVAEAGDILIARVDRRLEHKVALVEDGAAEISDCVLRLRAPSPDRERVLAGLVSEEGRRQIVATSRGTGPKHISYKAILSIQV
ncbi:N-6 DNA methylase [Sphingomonas sp.]|uniref:N-6 DNA methylase n=1 Tax=Sphingomonas sp. TaxID=28214 RepID=UPI002E364DC9|nr:N-6 DNA methylase [Sphingomonas sp.]HEX4693558.1 N-6 DNA methylase [Sphingomonas sp.]